MSSTMTDMTTLTQRGVEKDQVILDIPALKAHLDGVHREVRDAVREQLRSTELTPPLGMTTPEHRAWALQATRYTVGKAGLPLGYPSEYGGGDDVGGGVAAFEMLSYGDLSAVIKIGVHWGLFGGAVMKLGTDYHHDRYLADIVSFRLPGCFAMTESGHGSDVQSIRTTATYDSGTDELVIHTPDDAARKDYIGNAGNDGRIAAVFAQLVVNGECHGVHTILVPLRDEEGNLHPGVRIEDSGPKTGLHGIDNARIWFDQVRVPRSELLNRYGSISEEGVYSSPIKDPNRRFFTMLGTLVQGRISIGGSAINAGKTGLAIALRHAEGRTQFERPNGEEVTLLDYRSHQRRLLPHLATLCALHFAQAEVLDQFVAITREGSDENRDHRKFEARVAGHKAYATWKVRDALQEAREACGGVGYLQQSRVGTLRADTDIYTTFEGDNTVLSLLVTKGLLTAYKDQFESLDTFGTVRFVATQALQSALERGAAHGLIERIRNAGPKKEEDAGLRTRSWHLALMEQRETQVVETLARRLRSKSRKTDTFTAFNECQDHVLAAARVHTERLTLEAFAAGVATCPDDSTRMVLNKLCDLYALTLLENDRAWFVEHGRLSVGRSKALRGAINELCAELRPHALDVVAAFDIPENLLGVTLPD